MWVDAKIFYDVPRQLSGKFTITTPISKTIVDVRMSVAEKDKDNSAPLLLPELNKR